MVTGIFQASHRSYCGRVTQLFRGDEPLQVVEPIEDDMESWPRRLLVPLNHEETLAVG